MNKDQTSVLITNVHSSLNCGDLALLDGLVRRLNNSFSEPQITVVANWPNEDGYPKGSNIQVVPSPWSIIGESQRGPIALRVAKLVYGRFLAGSVRRLSADKPGNDLSVSWKNLFRSYQTADLVIGVAGNQFYSTGRIGWPFPASAFSVELAHIFRKPFYTMPQSIGPFKRGWEKLVMRQIYSRARRVYLREWTSIELAKSIGIPADRIKFAPDPAFGYPSASQDAAQHVLARYNDGQQKLKVGVTVIAPLGRSLNEGYVKRYYVALARLLNQLIAQFGVHIYFFNQVTGPNALEDDRKAVEQVISQMGQNQGVTTWVNETLSPELLKACYGQMDFFIASRLHSGIFALGMGVPTLFIGYLTKTRGVLRALGLESWVIDLSEIQDDKLEQAGVSAWLEREQQQALIKEILPSLIIEAKKPMDWVIQDYLQNHSTGFK